MGVLIGIVRPFELPPIAGAAQRYGRDVGGKKFEVAGGSPLMVVHLHHGAEGGPAKDTTKSGVEFTSDTTGKEREREREVGTESKRGCVCVCRGERVIALAPQ
jgi:hypothetical protein